MKLKISLYILYFTLYILLAGCEAFTRKFTRKPKRPKITEEPVLVFEVYPESTYSIHDMYKDYYFIFRSWLDELINHLEPAANQKKRAECVREAKANLLKMQSVLKEEKQKELEPYIQKIEDIENQIRGFLSQDKFYNLKNQCISLKTKISKSFSYSKIKDFIR